MMDLVLDVETTIFKKGNPFSRRNKLCYVGYYNGTHKKIYTFHNSFAGIRSSFNDICFIGFNIKFDLHWVRRLHGSLDFHNCTIWDCQLAEFILNNQRRVLPSLNDACANYSLGIKFDIVRTQYWGNGIDTLDIPIEVMLEYLTGDLELTYKLKKAQEERFKLPENQQKFKLFKAQCEDLLVLEEMEWNGQKYNTKLSLERTSKIEAKIEQISEELKEWTKGYPINLDSNDHLSCLLYGGEIIHTQRIPIGVYKSGEKQGLPRYKLIDINYKFEPLFKPIKGSELAKSGYYSTAEPILRSLKGTKNNRKLLTLLLERNRIEKLRGTYYQGLPELINTMDWEPDTIHGQFNQCIAATGRLTSSQPNLQNFAGEVKELLETRYAS